MFLRQVLPALVALQGEEEGKPPGEKKGSVEETEPRKSRPASLKKRIVGKGTQTKTNAHGDTRDAYDIYAARGSML
jgi:hypothetical protein